MVAEAFGTFYGIYLSVIFANTRIPEGALVGFSIYTVHDGLWRVSRISQNRQTNSGINVGNCRVSVPKLNVILHLICKDYFAEQDQFFDGVVNDQQCKIPEVGFPTPRHVYFEIENIY